MNPLDLTHFTIVGNFPFLICGQPVQVQVAISNTWAARVNFTLMGTPYEFMITKWRFRGVTNFAQLFHSFWLNNDIRMQTRLQIPDLLAYETKFGGMRQVAPNVFAPDMTDPEKNRNLVLQGVFDVLESINRIFQQQGRGMFDYAVWHKENKAHEDTYGRYIMLIACHCIVHSNFMAPNVSWNEVVFD